MKIAGRNLTIPNIEIIVLPRQDGPNGECNDIVIKAQGILDNTEFDKILPQPQPPKQIAKGGAVTYDVKNPIYLANLSSFGEKRMAWIVLKSLEATEGLTWDTVDMGNPETWNNYRTELKEANFSDVEIVRIVNTVMAANSLNEERLDEARKRFLASEQVQPATL